MRARHVAPRVALQVRQLGLEGLEALRGDRLSIAHRAHCGGPAAAASRTSASRGRSPKPCSHQVAPAALELGQALGVRALVVDEHHVERPGALRRGARRRSRAGAHVVAGQRRLVADREDAVVARRAHERAAVGPHAAQPHRRARPLQRRRAHLRRSSSAKAAPSRRHGLAAPQLDHQLERLVEQRRASARVALLAEGAQLAPAVAAQAGAEDHAPAREAVEHGDLARDVPRAPARQRRDHRAQAQALGGQRDGGQRDPRIGDRRARRRS